MSASTSLVRHSIIINKLRKQPASRREIEAYLKRESELRGVDLTIDRRTLTRDLESILSNYAIEIKYDPLARVYRIISDDQDKVTSRMLEAFDTIHALNISDSLAGYVYFENRKPSGTEHLYGLFHAVKNRLVIKFQYQKYWDDKPNPRKAEPYALREFKNRWYVHAKDQADGITKSFALDRLTEPEITKKTFKKDPSYNPEQIFKDCFGIISPNEPEPGEVLLSFDPHQGKYIKSMPLHPSQQTVTDNENELQVSLKVYITHDLIMELLSYGESVTVLKPEKLKAEIKIALQSALGNYI